MKYCQHCGAQIEHEEAVICVKCGCPIPGSYKQEKVEEKDNTINVLIIVFMWVSTGLLALSTLGIALAWCLPMTLSVQGKINRGEKIGTGMAVCTLIFVSLVSGILMLVKED